MTNSQQALSDSATANETANTANATANTANTNANQALINIANFNLSTIEEIENFSTTLGSIPSGTKITVAKNSDGSLAKIYGTMMVNTAGVVGRCSITCQSSLRPKTDITISPATIVKQYGTNLTFDQTIIQIRSLTIRTNGQIEFDGDSTSTTAQVRIYLLPCLYYIKDFGDVPIPE